MTVVENMGNTEPMYVFDSRADAEEFLLSIAEGFEYIQFCCTKPEDFFGSLALYKDWNINNKNMSMAGASLIRAVDRYEIKEAKYVL